MSRLTPSLFYAVCKATTDTIACNRSNSLSQYWQFKATCLQSNRYNNSLSTMASSVNSSGLTGEEDLIILRHGQSSFNRGFLDYVQSTDVSLKWDDCIKIDEFNEKVSYAEEHFDCSITAEGVKQCQSAKEQLKDVQIGIVLVSPHQRALETCQQIFGGRDVRVEVHPILAEVFRFSCDISHHLDEKMKQFPHFDFGHMKDYSELWFVEILAQRHTESCLSHIEKHQPQTYEQKQRRILELVKEKVIYESPQELRERIWKVKALLQEYRQKYKRIAIVSHFQVITTLIAREYNEQGTVVGAALIQNARPMHLRIGNLLQIK